MTRLHDRGADTGALHELVALHAVDALEPAEQAAFERHLPGCPRCRAELADHAEVTARLAEAVAQDPPPALRTSVLEAVRDSRPLLGAPDVTTHRIEVEGGTAALHVSQEQDTALFVSTGLPDPGPGREYQLWLVQEDDPVPDVHFTGGQVRTWLDGEVADAAAVAMTVEPAGGSATPTLPVVAATEI